MSLPSDLIDALDGLEWRDLEPEELRRICTNPVFRAIAKYCLGSHDDSEGRYDNDELGIDPEEDVSWQD